MTVTDRRTTEPVQGAGVWALTRDKMDSLQADLKALKEDTALAAEEKDYESLMDIYGEFLGRTNGSGQVNHVFEEKGYYLLVTVKPGYFPGWTAIHIINSPEKDLSENGVKSLISRKKIHTNDLLLVTSFFSFNNSPTSFADTCCPKIRSILFLSSRSL